MALSLALFWLAWGIALWLVWNGELKGDGAGRLIVGSGYLLSAVTVGAAVVAGWRLLMS